MIKLFITNGKKYLPVIICLILISIVLAGCLKSKDKDEVYEQVYATVNGVHLTESGLRAIVPKDFYNRLTNRHKRKIIEEWVNKEVLYQEALRLEIDKDSEIKRLLLESKRNLLCNELLERELSNIKIPSEDKLKKYYEGHKEYFELPTDEYRVRYALFDTKKDATAFYIRVKRSESFTDLAKKLSKDPNSLSIGIFGIINEESVEQSIWDNVVSLYEAVGKRKISDTFSVIDGWGCVIIDEVFKAGSVKPFKYIQDMVMDMYMAEQREDLQEALIKRLSVKAEIKYEFP